MVCPRCAGDIIKTMKTVQKDDTTIRTRYCEVCHKIFKTEERVTEVSIIHQATLKAEFINAEQYERGLASGRTT